MSLYDLFTGRGSPVVGRGGALAVGACRRRTPPQAGVCAAAAIFLVFGVTDWLELGTGGRLPLWLWGLKVACGAGIFAAATNGAAGPASLERPGSAVWSGLPPCVAIIVTVQHVGPQ